GRIVPMAWQRVIFAGCRADVPQSWHTAGHGNLLIAPHGTRFSLRAFEITDWKLHKSQILDTFGRTITVHENSERRLWIEIAGQQKEHFIDVREGTTACAGILDVTEADLTPSDEARIAANLAPVPIIGGRVLK